MIILANIADVDDNELVDQGYNTAGGRMRAKPNGPEPDLGQADLAAAAH